MLWAFIATIAIGFLFTAASNWTGLNPLRGPALAGLCGLWLLARLAFLVPDMRAYWLGVGSELLFFAIATAALARVIYPRRSRRNYGLPVMVALLGLSDALYLLAAPQGDYTQLMRHFHAGLLSMGVIALLVARRVIPFFASRAVSGLDLPLHTHTGAWQLAAGVLAVLCTWLSWPQAAAAALVLAGGLALWQTLAWKPWSVRHQPLLWVLYAGYASLGAGLLVAAAHAVGGVARLAWPVHVIGMAGFSVLIIGMVTRTALGHLGRPLRTDHSMVISYGLIILSAAFRLLALLPASASLLWLQAAAWSWVLGWALYLWRFFPLLIRPRLGQPDARIQRPATPPRT